MDSNSDRLFQEYDKRKTVLSAAPAVLLIESVQGCPCSCVMCDARQTELKRISPDVLEKIEPLYDHLEILTIHGLGEPLLGDVDYFVSQAEKHRLILHMNSTGFFLSTRKVESLLKVPLSIRFSVHSGRPETYHKIFGRDFDRVMNNIQYLTSKNGDSRGRNDFWFSFIVMKEDIDEIGDFLQLAHDCGIKKVRFMRLHPNRQSLKGIVIPERAFRFSYFEQYNKQIINQFNENFSDYQDMAGKLGITIKASSIIRPDSNKKRLKSLANIVFRKLFRKNVLPVIKRRGHCIAPWVGQLLIKQNGDVLACCRNHYRIGNIHESPFHDIWNSGHMIKLRESFNRGYMPKTCGYCQGIDLEEFPNFAFGVYRTQDDNILCREALTEIDGSAHESAFSGQTSFQANRGRSCRKPPE